MRTEEKYKDLYLMPHQWEPFNGDHYLQKMILAFKDQHEIKTAIECGTCLGSSALWFVDNFDKSITIEVNKTFYDIAKERLKNRSNVTTILADTRAVLAQQIASVSGQYLIFLDSHWGNNNPLLEELEIIAQSGTQPVIVIHDFKNPLVPTMGYDEYPNEGIVYEWSYIEKSINKIYPNGFDIRYNTEATEVNRGCIFLSPKPNANTAERTLQNA